MDVFELEGEVDESRNLRVELPQAVPTGPVKIVLKPVSSLDEEDGWAEAIGLAWLKDWSDPREDIYTLTDGEPVDGRPG